jgi:hypothetical protein
MSDRRIVRHDRHGRPEYAASTSPAALRAVAILRATIDREDRKVQAELKARQDAGQLNPQERLLSAIFGEIK